jgi:hypothetical protein
MLRGSRQKARGRLPHLDLGHTNILTAGVATGANSFVSSEWNRINPTSCLVRKAGVAARCAVEMGGRGSWKKPRPFRNEMDRDCNIVLPCKRADFQRVIRDERTRGTFMGGNSK